MEQIKRIKGDSVHLISVSGDRTLKLSQINMGGGGARPHYQGQTEFIPSREQQTAPTAGTLVDTDIIIKPIPNNWGLITWNGAVLTVS